MTAPVWEWVRGVKGLFTLRGARRIIRAIGDRTIFHSTELKRREADVIAAAGNGLVKLAEARSLELELVARAITILRDAGVSERVIRDTVTHRVELILGMAEHLRTLDGLLRSEVLQQMTVEDLDLLPENIIVVRPEEGPPTLPGA